MAIRINSAHPASGTMVVTLMKNLVDTALAITIPVNAPVGASYYNNVNQVSWAYGELFTIKIKNNATAASALLTSFSVKFLTSTE